MDAGAPFTEIDEAIANLETWMRPEEVALPGTVPGAKARIIHEPKGRVLIFGPWNFPFGLLFQPLVGAIAAGNTAILKPSELVPETSAVSTKIIRETFDEAEVAAFEGGPDVAAALLDQPFDHIFFTGSTAVGRKVMMAASRHLSSVTLELGGKCPAVIDDSFSLKTAANRIAWGKYLNSGQICLAPDHVWIPRERRDAFVSEVTDYIQQSYYRDDRLTRSDLAHIVNRRNLERTQSLLRDAVARGAQLVCGGSAEGLQLEPTVLIDVPRDCAMMQEEIFGPILPVLTYEGVDDVCDEINSRDKPLALYVFSDAPSFVDTILTRTSSGGVTINDVLQHAATPGLPFGGVGASGMGAYHGIYSFREMSHARSVYHQGPVNPAEGFLRPPYGDRMPI